MSRIIGDNLKVYRRQCGYTPRRLAELCEMDVETVREIEKGLITPDPEQVANLADAVRTLPERIYGLETAAKRMGVVTRTLRHKDSVEVAIEWDRDKYELVLSSACNGHASVELREIRSAGEEDLL